jgi:hypothetical protein
MSELGKALEDFTRLFNELSIPYVVMGGIAVRVYGIPRPTYDIDITIAIGRPRLPALYDAIRQIGYFIPESYEQGWVDQVAGMPLVKARLYLGERGVDIDLFLAESQYQQQLLVRRRQEAFGESSVWLVSPEDLVLLKLLAHRPRDLADIGDILFTQGQLEETYMRHWAERLGVLDGLEEVLKKPPSI